MLSPDYHREKGDDHLKRAEVAWMIGYAIDEAGVHTFGELVAHVVECTSKRSGKAPPREAERYVQEGILEAIADRCEVDIAFVERVVSDAVSFANDRDPLT